MTATFTAVSAQGQSLERDLRSLLSPATLELAPVETGALIKQLRRVEYDGRSMRERFQYRGDSLWWFTELYLHKTRELESAVLTILALEALRDECQPSRLRAASSSRGVLAAALAFGRAHGIPVEAVGATAPRSLRWPSFEIGLHARLSRIRTPPRHVDRPPAVAAFVHTAFWREAGERQGPRQESYVGAVLDAVARDRREGDLFCVGVGPRRNFRARRWWDPIAGSASGSRLVTPVERLAPGRALKESLRLWRDRRRLARAIVTGEAIRSAAAYRGCDLWDVLESELRGVAMLQWPWSARAMDEAGAALEALTPGAVVTYAEAGGWGRALIIEARRRGVPSIGLQHGFIYRHWLNYRHEPDEMQPLGNDRGCPIPDRTLVFDRFAERHLIDAGRYPPAAVRVTGNARLDDLAAQVALLRPARSSVRATLGLPAGQPVALLAAKHAEIAANLADLVAAVRSLPEVRLVIKPHPAETADAYRGAIAGVSNITIAGPDADLAHLLTAADAIVTRNSTVAIDGLALGVPALVIGLPNNLSPFVDAGAMAGANGATAAAEALRMVLYDGDARRALIQAGAAFARRFEMIPDGRAAERAVNEILVMATHPAGKRTT